MRNKATLVAQGYSQIEMIDYEEIFLLVARLKSIRILLAITCYLRIKLYQTNVKSCFLNEILSEEVYVEKPKGFEDPKFPNHIYRLKKALYEGKQAPIARYERLITYLLEKKFEKMRVDKTLFIHMSKNELLMTQIYVDNIVFRATPSDLALSFIKEIKTEFEMCIVGELTFFLGLLIRQLKDRIFLSQPSILGS